MKKLPAHLFTSFKALRPIPAGRHIQIRDYLIQATFDPDVRAIDYQHSVAIGDRVVAVEGIMVDKRDGRRFAVDIVDIRPVCDPDGKALARLVSERDCSGVITVTTADIRVEPYFSAARLLWSTRSVRVHPHDHAEILSALKDEGSMTLAHFDRVVGTRGDTFTSLFAMVCDGSIEIDLHHGLGLDAIVRVGKVSPAARRIAHGA